MELINRKDALDISASDSEIYIAINCLPTVEAIPIEWIYENAGEYFSGLEVLHLYQMIEDWEKENDR